MTTSPCGGSCTPSNACDGCTMMWNATESIAAFVEVAGAFLGPVADGGERCEHGVYDFEECGRCVSKQLARMIREGLWKTT